MGKAVGATQWQEVNRMRACRCRTSPFLLRVARVQAEIPQAISRSLVITFPLSCEEREGCG